MNNKQSMSYDDLGDRMKMYEGQEAGRHFIPHLPIIARMDGAVQRGQLTTTFMVCNNYQQVLEHHKDIRDSAEPYVLTCTTSTKF